MSIDLSQITGAEYSKMSEEDQLRVMTEVYRELFWRSIQDWSQHAIDVIEEQGINDHEAGESNVQIPLAFMRTCALLLQQCFTNQHRRELQAMSEDTQFAASLAESIYDHVTEIQKLSEDVVTLQSYYSACLSHRKESKVNMIDEDGTTVPYSEEALMQEELIREEHEREWKKEIRKQRAELERVYTGEQEPDPLEDGYDSAQLPLPLWTVGFAVV